MSTPERTDSVRRERGRPSLRAEQKTFARTKFVEAAVRTFEVKGFSGATVDDIAAEAGSSRATFYVHFKNKDEVAHAVFELMVPQSAEAFAQLDEAISTRLRANVREWVRIAWAWWDDNRGAVLALEQILATGGFGHGGLDQVQSDSMPELLSRWGAERREEVRLRIYLLSTIITRAHRAWRIDGLFAQLVDDDVLDTITDLLISGLELPVHYPDGSWDR